MTRTIPTVTLESSLHPAFLGLEVTAFISFLQIRCDEVIEILHRMVLVATNNVAVGAFIVELVFHKHENETVSGRRINSPGRYPLVIRVTITVTEIPL